MIYVLYFIHVVISIFLILVVLLQRGRGADLSVFGGGATQAAFGARGQASLLHKLTVICFVLFILTTLSIGVFEAVGDPSAMRGLPATAEQETPAAPAPDTGSGAAGGGESDAATTPGAESQLDTPAPGAEEPAATQNEETEEPPPAEDEGDGSER